MSGFVLRRFARNGTVVVAVQAPARFRRVRRDHAVNCRDCEMIRNAGAICDRRLVRLPRQCVESERSSAHGEDGLEAAKDKTSGVEWRFPGRIQTLVLMHLRFGGPEACLVWPDLPGENYSSTNFRRDRAAEFRLFSVWNVILPALNDFQASIVL